MAKINEKDAKLISTRDDDNLYYLVKDGKNYIIKMIQAGIEKEQVITYVEEPTTVTTTTQTTDQLQDSETPEDELLSENPVEEKKLKQVITEKDV